MKKCNLYDRLETQLRELETLGVTQDKYAAMLYPLVESCLPEEVRRTWERYRHQGEDNQVGTLSKLKKFLRGEVNEQERILLAKSFLDSSSSEKKNPEKRERGFEESSSTAIDLFSG